MNPLICPVSLEKVDNTTSRVTIFLNVILLAMFMWTLNMVYLLIPLVDYAIRSSTNTRFSPMRFIAVGITKALGLKKVPANLAPKMFSARLGVIFTAAALALTLAGFLLAAQIIIGMVLVLAVLNSVFNWCAGCMIYTYIVLPFHQSQNRSEQTG